MSAAETVVFLHGLGDRPDDWSHQITALPGGLVGVPLGIPGLTADDESAGGGEAGAPAAFDLARAADLVADDLDRRGLDRVHLCGLSLGAMIALRLAASAPGRVRSLTLVAGQVRPPRRLMAAQLAVVRVLPERLVASGGASKARMLAVLRGVRDVDLTPELRAIAAPTLVVCGSRDRANLAAARLIAESIPSATLGIVAGAGHRVHVERPAALSAVLNPFLSRHLAREDGPR